MSRDPNKGLLNGKCFRGACPNADATWYSSIEQQHYCQSCAFAINEHLPKGLARIVNLAELHKMFVQINEDCKITGESVVDFGDTVFYRDQIFNLEIAPNNHHALLIAEALCRYHVLKACETQVNEYHEKYPWMP